MACCIGAHRNRLQLLPLLYFKHSVLFYFWHLLLPFTILAFLQVLTIILFGIIFQTTKINQAACGLAKEVAKEGGVHFAGCINHTAFLYSQGAGKDVVLKKFREQIEIFLQYNADLIIAEVSCLELHLNYKLKLTIQIHSSVLISVLELGAATLIFYYIIFRLSGGQNTFNLLYSNKRWGLLSLSEGGE